MKLRNMTRLNNAGLTLIEIIIVITIIGSLMAFLAQKVFSGRDKAKYQEAKLSLGTLAGQIQNYYQDCNQFPPDLNALLAGGEGTCKNWGPEPYAKKKDLLDPWGTPFEYYLENNQFVLVSLGADKKPDGTGYGKDLSTADADE